MALVPAPTLWILAAIRLPFLTAPRRAGPFRVTLFAAVASTPYVPDKYKAVDPLMGVRNRVCLATLLFLRLGF
ncbi:hypothetical protein [Specibacter cremeus]|uniref:hypothetical protein n=1 Tax=Specibacter cremeus TaxID=1629051 RepID=UPI000F769BF0|nr:hypothetical protein [Specibacter cremeus]